jgi:hypothetical protein
MLNPNDITLGCADDYTVIITARDLETYAAQVDWSTLSWSRVLDEVSAPPVTVPDVFGGLRCNIELGTTVRPWRFGIRIERNGQLVWAGPIVSVERPVRNGAGTDFVTITAQDKMAWMSKRTITDLLAFVGEDAGTVFKSVIDESTEIDNVFDLVCPEFTTGYTMTREIVPLDFEYSLDILTEIANAAVDYTVIGTELVVQESASTGIPQGWYALRDGDRQRWAPTEDPFGRYIFGLFTDEAYDARPGFTLDGYAQGNNIYVPGADSGEAGFRRVWSAFDVDPLDGVLTYVDVNTLYRPQEDPIVADAVFQQRADSLLAWKKTTPAIVSGGTLGQQAPITVDRLFPGSLWTMDLAEKGIEELLTVQRLKRVDVEVSINGGGFVERVSPTMIPIGTDETQGG